MSISTEITRLSTAKTTLKNKGVELGISLDTDKIDAIATKFDAALIDRGDISANVKEGETFTIPKGYHGGAGTVSGIAGGGDYGLQSKSVTPTKTQQTITPDSGNYGLSDVIVAPIPGAYQDVTSVTAVAGDVLATKVIVASDGTAITGTMANNGTVNTTINGLTVSSYTIAAGYYAGGSVSLTDDIETALSEI